MDELHALPVASWTARNAHLYLWTTNKFMCEAHALAVGWGFDPKTIITWGKVHDNGTPSRKMGFYYRSATEHIVFAVRGHLRLTDPDPAPSTLILHRRLPHSVKPDAFYDMVERYSPGPYLDVFSRRARLGWTTWGDESLHGMDVANAE
jgi:N6-adenosine-specific RNA methylase IME4